MQFATIEEAIAEIQEGRKIIIVDDEDRENEGDLIVPADQITPAVVNFMLREARGMLFVALDGESCDRLKLNPETRNCVNVALKANSAPVERGTSRSARPAYNVPGRPRAGRDSSTNVRGITVLQSDAAVSFATLHQVTSMDKIASLIVYQGKTVLLSVKILAGCEDFLVELAHRCVSRSF